MCFWMVDLIVGIVGLCKSINNHDSDEKIQNDVWTVGLAWRRKCLYKCASHRREERREKRSPEVSV